MGAPHLRNLAKKRGKNTQTEGMWGGGDCVWFLLPWQIPEVNNRNCGGLTSACGLRGLRAKIPWSLNSNAVAMWEEREMAERV